ncbi:MAG: hypothetical protein V1672_05625 [Candidatus Diapherotrites archaeon]
MDRKIELSNMPELDSMTKQLLIETAERQYDKFEKFFGESTSLKINFKESSKTGNKSRYDVNAMLITNNKTLASKATEWDVVSALQKALSKLNNEAVKAMK